MSIVMLYPELLGTYGDAGNALAGERGIDFDDQALPGAVIDDRQTAESSAICQSIGYEVH